MEVEEFRICLGHNLRDLRKKRNLTQSALAELIGIETHNLNRIENGKSFPQAKTLVNIINYFGILPYELFLERDEEISSIVDILKKNPDRIEDISSIAKVLTGEK